MTMMVRAFNGRKISQPGVYRGIPMETYHGDLCVRPSLSSSGIRTIFSKSAAHYFEASYLNPDAEPMKQTEALLFGRAAHHLLLGEADFRAHFAVRPDTYRDDEAKEKPWNGNAKTCRLWLKEAKEQGLDVVKTDQLIRIRGMAEALKREPLIRAGVLNGRIEHSIVWQDKETGVWLKVRPDAIPAADMAFADLKTIEDITDDGIERAIADHDLHVQGALVGMACRDVLGREMESFSLVFSEKARPHCVRVVEISGADLDLGEQQIRAVLPIFAKACETGVWHGPGGGQQDATYFPVRPYRVKQIERRLEILALEAG